MLEMLAPSRYCRKIHSKRFERRTIQMDRPRLQQHQLSNITQQVKSYTHISLKQKVRKSHIANSNIEVWPCFFFFKKKMLLLLLFFYFVWL